MNNANQPNPLQVDMGYIEDAKRPVIPYHIDVEHAFCAEPHAHPRAQLIFASAGVMRVITTDNTWLVPPPQAVWAPSRIKHQVYFPGKVAVRNLFIDPHAAAQLPDQCLVFNVSPFLRELILRIFEIGESDGADSPAARLMQVMLDELRLIKPAPLNLPMSHEPRLYKVLEGMLAAPEDSRTLEQWAQAGNVADRTLSRLFMQELGMSFGEWRTRLRMLEAVDRLGQGQAVTRVAFDLGYRNLSAFIAMFRKTLGKTPGKYFQ